MADFPFYFAWAGPNEAFNPSVHAVLDEDILKFEVEQSEGNFAAMTIEVRNPRIGLLAPARKVWAWLSYQSESSIIPLFYGRLVGVPTDINQETVTMQFTARPADFVALKAALAETLKVRPYYDPIWINPDKLDDPDTVLEARSQLWCIDRVSHEVSVSDILVGEDGVEEFLASEVPYDSVKITLGQTPLRSVTVDATVNWTQQATGTLDFGISVDSYTGQSLISDWPKTGSNLSGGWKVVYGSAIDTNNVGLVQVSTLTGTWTNPEKEHAQGDTMSISDTVSLPLMRGPSLIGQIKLEDVGGFMDPFADPPVNRPAHSATTYLYVPLWHVSAHMTLGYDANRVRKEHARFTLQTNTQAIVTLPGDAESMSIKIDSVDIGLPVGPSEEIPIGNLSRRSYFPTDRGLRSLEYLINIARANLLIRSRIVEVTFACKFERAIALTMRKDGLLHDPRLPGHQAVGKIINYKFSVDGSLGLKIGSVTIGCAVGYGNAVTGENGNPTYVEEGYMIAGYQVYTNKIEVLPAGDVSYITPIDAPNDDGLRFPLTKGQVVLGEQIIGTADAQADAINASFLNDTTVATANPQTIEEQNAFATAQANTTNEILKTNVVKYRLELRPINTGPFENAYDITVSQLEVPKQIDLEAAA